MISQNYTRSNFDHCVYFRKLQDGSFIYLLLYVDDMLIASKNQGEICSLKAQLSKEFEMKDLGEAKKILGMEIARDRQRGTLCLTQKQVTVFCDSQSAIHLAKNQVYHARTKHIDVRYHFVREIIEEGGVLVQKIKTDDNPADMLTKVVTTIKFNHCLDLINIAKV